MKKNLFSEIKACYFNNKSGFDMYYVEDFYLNTFFEAVSCVFFGILYRLFDERRRRLANRGRLWGTFMFW